MTVIARSVLCPCGRLGHLIESRRRYPLKDGCTRFYWRRRFYHAADEWNTFKTCPVRGWRRITEIAAPPKPASMML